MKLSEIRPCDNCKGPLVPIFRIVKVSVAGFDMGATNETLGLNMMFGGNVLRLAEVLGARAEEAIKIIEDEVEIFLCNDCYCGFPKPIYLAGLIEQRCEIVEKAKEVKDDK